MVLRQTHTYVTLEISVAAYDEIAKKLQAAGYDHAFDDSYVPDEALRPLVCMNGIALSPTTNPVSARVQALFDKWDKENTAAEPKDGSG